MALLILVQRKYLKNILSLGTKELIALSNMP